MDETPPESGSRKEVTNQFWETQFRQKCFYKCEACIIKKQAIDTARKTGNVEDVIASIQKTEVCEIVATYTRPIWWLPFVGRMTFMIVSDKGHQEFFSVCRINILSLFKKHDS